MYALFFSHHLFKIMTNYKQVLQKRERILAQLNSHLLRAILNLFTTEKLDGFLGVYCNCLARLVSFGMIKICIAIRAGYLLNLNFTFVVPSLVFRLSFFFSGFYNMLLLIMWIDGEQISSLCFLVWIPIIRFSYNSKFYPSITQVTPQAFQLSLISL